MKAECTQIVIYTKGIQNEWFWNEFWPRARPPPPHVLAYLRSRCSKLELFFLTFPNVCLLISRRWKKISTNGLHHCKLHLWENLSLEYERNRTKLRYWKIVGNEKCTPEIAKLSSVKNLFWANHLSEKAHISLKRKIFEWTNVPDKINWLYSVTLENWVRNRQKTPKKA